MDEVPEIEPPLHDNCRCAILPMGTITPSGATKDKENGADFYLANFGKLPDYDISDSELRALGWKNGKPPKRGMLQGKCIQGMFMTMMTGICPPRRDAFGMNRTSITMRGAATDIEFCILMTA